MMVANKDEIIVQLLYLWTRDAKIDVTPEIGDWAYLSNQIENLGKLSQYSDPERELFARGVLARINLSQRCSSYVGCDDLDCPMATLCKLPDGHEGNHDYENPEERALRHMNLRVHDTPTHRVRGLPKLDDGEHYDSKSVELTGEVVIQMSGVTIPEQYVRIDDGTVEPLHQMACTVPVDAPAGSRIITTVTIYVGQCIAPAEPQGVPE